MLYMYEFRKTLRIYTWRNMMPHVARCGLAGTGLGVDWLVPPAFIHPITLLVFRHPNIRQVILHYSLYHLGKKGHVPGLDNSFLASPVNFFRNTNENHFPKHTDNGYHFYIIICSYKQDQEPQQINIKPLKKKIAVNWPFPTTYVQSTELSPSWTAYATGHTVYIFLSR